MNYIMNITDLAIGFIMGIFSGLAIGFVAHHHANPTKKHFKTEEKHLRIALIAGILIIITVIIILITLSMLLL